MQNEGRFGELGEYENIDPQGRGSSINNDCVATWKDSHPVPLAACGELNG